MSTVLYSTVPRDSPDSDPHSYATVASDYSANGFGSERPTAALQNLKTRVLTRGQTLRWLIRWTRTVTPRTRIAPDKCLCRARHQRKHLELSSTTAPRLWCRTNIGAQDPGLTQKGVSRLPGFLDWYHGFFYPAVDRSPWGCFRNRLLVGSA